MSSDLSPLSLSHRITLESLAFDPRGRFVLSGASDSSVILWDKESGAEFRRFEGHTDGVESVAFTPNGRYALSGSFDGSVIIWQLPIELNELIQWSVNNRYVRDLTCTERRLYRVEPLCE